MKQKLQYIFYNFSIRTRFMIFFSMVALLIVIVMLLVSLILITRLIKDNSSQSLSLMMDQAANQIDTVFASTERMERMIAMSQDIQSLLKRQEVDIQERLIMYRSTITDGDQRLMYLTNTVSHYIPGAYVIGENGSVYKSTYTTLKNNDFRQADWYQQILSEQSAIYFDKYTGSRMSAREIHDCFSVGMRIVDVRNGDILGAVMADMDINLLYNIVEEYMLHTSGCTYFVNSMGDQVLINREDHEVPLLFVETALRQENGVNSAFLQIDGEEYHVYSRQLGNGWLLIHSTLSAELTQGTNIIVTFALAITLLMVIISLIFAWILANSVSKPIMHMNELMHKVERGDFQVRMKVQYTDEIGQLGNSFNTMINEVNNLILRVNQEQNKLRIAQLKVYQEQINPHFLYNTLDTINWLVRMGDAEKAVAMIQALTKLLRIGLSKGRTVITVQEELHHVVNYLTIQKLRYEDMLNYTLEYPREMEMVYTPKLILQPLVENAIYHGIKQKRGGGTIEIQACIDTDTVLLTISDTGAGIPRAQLKSIREMLAGTESEGADYCGFGIKNVNDRIKAMYGARYGLDYQSTPGEGTTATITIPLIMEAGEDA